MLHNRSFTPNRSIPLLTASVALAVLMGTVLALRGSIWSPLANPAAGVDQPALSAGYNAQRVMNAAAARWEGLAETYTSRQRAIDAYTARYEALAQMYTETSAGYDAQRAANAAAARWSGLAEMYGKGIETAQDSQHADIALAAHYTGLAIQEYVRTGDRKFLPTCISPEVMALLPHIGDDTWRAEVANCGE